MRPRARLIGIVLAALATTARAWPVDLYVDVEPGREIFRRVAKVDWMEIDDPKIATAEKLESGEILITGKAAGRALLLLGADGKIAVWRVRVGQRPIEAGEALAAARKACPGLRASLEGEEHELIGSIADERCRTAMTALVKTDAFKAKDLELTVELPVMQGQLVAIEAALPAKVQKRVQLRYLGAELELNGTLTEAEHRKLLWAVFEKSLGRPGMEDNIDIEGAAPLDGGI